jgi:predicted nucleic acid-binding protein
MEVLVDTSVWIDHLRKPLDPLILLLHNGKVLSHSWIVGEISLGHLKSRGQFLKNLDLLPKVKEVSMLELSHFVENHSLHGMGLGLVDVQLLASAVLSSVSIFTRDKAMIFAMKKIKIELHS